MEVNTDNAKRLLDTLNSITLFQRIFGWRKVKQQLLDASADIQKLNVAATYWTGEKQRLDMELMTSRKDVDTLAARNTVLTMEIVTVKEKQELREQQVNDLKAQVQQLKQADEYRANEQITTLTTLKGIEERIRNERDKEINDRNAAELERIRKLKESWVRHEQEVKSTIKNICSKHTIEYVEQVPFKGVPDNTIRIAGEYIILDAKSPAGDDLKNFPAYIKAQCEQAKKYTKQENVKAEIYLVVPANTLDTLPYRSNSMGDYTVFIVTVDVLEPLLLCLKKIETYDFAEQLSPEERENICRIIGKFAHLSKRRIQVDSFFARQFIELAYKCETSLPDDIMEKVIDFERSEKLNPPQEKRTKQINLKHLEQDLHLLDQEVAAKGIVMSDLSTELNKQPLYKKTIEE